MDNGTNERRLSGKENSLQQTGLRVWGKNAEQRVIVAEDFRLTSFSLVSAENLVNPDTHVSMVLEDDE